MTKPLLKPLWHDFDAAWYRTAYKDVLGEALSLPDEGLQHWYETQGAFSGHSPNPYFDEEWYRRNCADALEGVSNQTYRSGFEHYCKRGYKNQSPHYLFSERYYIKQGENLTPSALMQQGYKNGYDHYLRVGAAEGLQGHLFFNPAMYQKHRATDDGLEALAPFRHFLLADRSLPDRVALSEYFDPIWYAKATPRSHIMVEYGYVPNLLYYFLSDFTPNGF